MIGDRERVHKLARRALEAFRARAAVAPAADLEARLAQLHRRSGPSAMSGPTRIEVNDPDRLSAALAAAGLSAARPVVVLIGGADGLAPRVAARLEPLFGQVLPSIARTYDSAVVDGGDQFRGHAGRRPGLGAQRVPPAAGGRGGTGDARPGRWVGRGAGAPPFAPGHRPRRALGR